MGAWINAANSLNKEFTEAEMAMLRAKMPLGEGKVQSTVNKEGFLDSQVVEEAPKSSSNPQPGTA